MANSFKSLIKAGFGLGIGLTLAQILFIFIGAAIFIPGFIMATKAKKNNQKGTTEQITGVVLMLVGALIMGGIGFGFALDSLGDSF
jgi:hypothetical protein